MARRTLPANPNLRQLRHQAKELLRERRSPGFSLKNAQQALAEAYGFDNWLKLKRFVEKRHRYDIEDLVAYTEAVRYHDVKALKAILAKDPSLVDVIFGVNTFRLNGEELRADVRSQRTILDSETRGTALQFLVFTKPMRNLDVARVLLERGADPDAVCYTDHNSTPYAPIVYAAWEGGVDAIRLLLEFGADVSGDQGREAL